jgi:hypothetical protein
MVVGTSHRHPNPPAPKQLGAKFIRERKGELLLGDITRHRRRAGIAPAVTCVDDDDWPSGWARNRNILDRRR